ncbi:Xaa-Pro dipeptidase [Amycolatopsis marina]|uniref:Xaa-Pro dipeptidase n=1 Tax=Amycolatopsis marina TaxID=490629 RepID=A0A1I1BBK3_9PSEU|nr:Xaa-Pro dipeptidase [Amycolatopsis marina]
MVPVNPADQSSVHHPDLVGLGGTPRPAWLEVPAAARVPDLEPRPFSDDEYRERLARIRDRLSQANLGGVLVFRPSSVEYLCGYHSMERVPQPLLVTRSAAFLYVPDLEIGRALASSVADTVLYYGYTQAPTALALVAEHTARALPDGTRLAVEFEHTSTPPRAVELLRRHGVELAPGDHLVEDLRLVLSPAELRCVEEAAVATQRGVEAAARAAGDPDATDSVIAAAVTEALLRDATSTSAWGPVVVAGPRAGVPHSSWRREPVGDGPVFLEFAGAHHRYHAPVMRTLCRGGPTADAQRLVELSQGVLDAVLGTAAAGVPCADVARRASEAIVPLPDDVVFHHLFGYPVGLAHPPHWMDSAPFHITVDNREPLREGMVFHIPASFRSFGRACVGLSQTFVVESDGARVLTHGAAGLIPV